MWAILQAYDGRAPRWPRRKRGGLPSGSRLKFHLPPAEDYASPIALPLSDQATTTLGRGGWLPSGQLLIGASSVPPSPGFWTDTNSAMLSVLNARLAISAPSTPDIN